jgi:RNA polymerase sigma factor (sigma-70 family)
MISPVPTSDYRLLHRYAFEADEAAFEELIRRHGRMAHGACRRVLGPAGDAEDAAQSAFLSLAEKARPLALRLGPHGSLAGWLYRVAVNAALQQRRAAKARRRREVAVVRDYVVAGQAVSSDVVTCVEQAELIDILDEALNELPQRYRTPLVLCHLEGKTQHEAALELGLSFGTLRRRLDRGRKLLKASMGRRGVVATSAMLALAWKSAAAQTTAIPEGLAAAVIAKTKEPPALVTFVRPRVTTPARVPVPVPTPPTSLSATFYAVFLAMLLLIVAIPSVVSLFTRASEGVASYESRAASTLMPLPTRALE